MLVVLCVTLLLAATAMACVDIVDSRRRAIWETIAGLLLVTGLALIGYGLARAF